MNIRYDNLLSDDSIINYNKYREQRINNLKFVRVYYQSSGNFIRRRLVYLTDSNKRTRILQQIRNF